MTNVLLSAKNLSHHYGSRVGCIDINFDIYPGEVLGVVGESGSGRTTLLKGQGHMKQKIDLSSLAEAGKWMILQN